MFSWIPMKFFKNKLNSLTYLVGNQQKNQIGYGIGTKFGPNYVQRCQKNKETGNIIRFFSYFTSGLPFKARGSGCKTA